MKKFDGEKGARAKFRRKNSYHILTRHQQKMGMDYFADSRNFCRTITCANSKSGNNAYFDSMLDDHKEVCAKRRSILSNVDPNVEEQDHDHVVEERDRIEDKESNIQLKSQR